MKYTLDREALNYWLFVGHSAAVIIVLALALAYFLVKRARK